MNDLNQRIAALSSEKRTLLELHLLRQNTQPKARSRAIPKRGHAGSAPLSFAQERLWLLHQLEPKSLAYNNCSVQRLTGELRVGILESALSALFQRHETLRTTFAVQDGEPVQLIHPAQAVELDVVDLTALNTEAPSVEVDRIVQHEASRPYDLESGPLTRIRLIRLAQEVHVLVFAMHHIIADGWSMAIWWRELSTLYAAFLDEHPSPLPELPIQYADFSHWQKDSLRSEEIEKQLRYWQRQLADAPVLIDG